MRSLSLDDNYLFTVAHSAHRNFQIQTTFRNANGILKPDRKLLKSKRSSGERNAITRNETAF